MNTAHVNGNELEYEVKGTGEPVLLMSNGPIRDTFLPFLSEDALVSRYTLITYRQRRMAEGAESPVTFAEHASDAFELLGHLGIRRAHVAGHSTGADIALQLAFDHPDAVHTLTLLEPPLLDVPSAGAFFEKVGPSMAAYGSGDELLPLAAPAGGSQKRAVPSSPKLQGRPCPRAGYASLLRRWFDGALPFVFLA